MEKRKSGLEKREPKGCLAKIIVGIVAFILLVIAAILGGLGRDKNKKI